jgi:hypothetical protein
MLYREIIAVCSQIHTKHINALCGQNLELLNVKPVSGKIKKRTEAVVDKSNKRKSGKAKVKL